MAYTDEMAQDAINTLFAAGTHTGIAFTYNDASGSMSASTVGQQPYSVSGFFTSAPVASEVLLDHIFAMAVNFGTNWTGSVGQVTTNPAASFVMVIKKNGSATGTITVSTGGAFTFATSANFAVGDRLQVVAPAGVDATVANLCFSLLGTR